MIARVISGGQTGVDIAALRAATDLQIKTGGWMPRGFRTLDGPRSDYASTFGMRECPMPGYPARTWANVRDSDVTMQVAVDFCSAGERCTRGAVVRFSKPVLDVTLVRVGSTIEAPPITTAADWIERVAGLCGRPHHRQRGRQLGAGCAGDRGCGRAVFARAVGGVSRTI